MLAPDAGWERARTHGGVEDPRITWIPALGTARHDLRRLRAARTAHRRSPSATDLRDWKRLGPLQFGYQPALDTDLNHFTNKDVVFFPEPVPGPDGRPCFAALHRPIWDLDLVAPGIGTYLPAGSTDDRPGIWISSVPVEEVARRHHRTDPATRPSAGRPARIPVRGVEDRRRSAPAARPGGLAAVPPRRHREAAAGRRPPAAGELRGRCDDPVRRRPRRRAGPNQRVRCSAPS